MPQWKQYSGTWPLAQQMQAVAAGTWTGGYFLYAFGWNNYGQLGDGTTTDKSTPTKIGSLQDWGNTAPKLAAGRYNGANIKQDGTLWLWGRNNYGQVGQDNTIDYSSPVQVGALTTWSYVTTSSGATFGIRTDGTLWAWGVNSQGQLGDGTVIARSSPVQIGALTTWSKVFGSESYNVYSWNTLAIKTDGTLWTWGRNPYGALGQNDLVYRSSPVQIGAGTDWAEAASGGNNWALGLKTNGTLWLWGRNNYGQLGQNDKIDRSSPVQIGALTTWLKASAGYATASAIKGGELWSWGYNGDGMVGDNTRVSRSSPVQIGALTTWDKVIQGAGQALAIKTDGTLWSWGYNAQGQLGTGDLITRSSPTQVGTSTQWQDIAASQSSFAILKNA